MGAKVKAGGTPYHGTRLVQVGLLPPQRAWLEAQAQALGCRMADLVAVAVADLIARAERQPGAGGLD